MGARLGEIFKENVNFKFMDIIDSRIYVSVLFFFLSRGFEGNANSLINCG